MVAIGKKPDAIEFIVAWTNCIIFNAEEVVEKICLTEEYNNCKTVNCDYGKNA